MKKYACSIVYEYSSNALLSILKTSVANLGFNPARMDIHFDHLTKSLDDIGFDEAHLFELLDQGLTFVRIKNMLYDEAKREELAWLSLRISVNDATGVDYIAVDWSNPSLDFLLAGGAMEELLAIPGIMYCYCFDQNDVFDQGNTAVASFRVNYPGETFKVLKDNHGDDIVDVSGHWGRQIYSRGLSFMAAPLMWIGNGYFKFAPRDVVSTFHQARTVMYGENHLFFIKLFDLYDSPAKKENRLAQERFWKHFNLHQRIRNYEDENPVDWIKWVIENNKGRKKG